MHSYHWAKAQSNRDIYKRATIPNPETHRVGAVLTGTPALLEGSLGFEPGRVFYSWCTFQVGPFKAVSLGGLVVHVCNLSTQESEAGGIASGLI